MSSPRPIISIRPAVSDDLPFVLSLVPRLVAFDLPPWREPGAVRASSETLLREAVTEPPAGSAVFVALFNEGVTDRIGFIHLETTPEFFTGEPQGYVANLAVAEAGEGRGIGRALMAAAEAWAKDRGMRHLALYVFAQNSRARAFYARLGFEEDSLKLIKPLE